MVNTPAQQGQNKGEAAAGTKGVSPEAVESGKEHDPNNFANDPARAADAGRKGGRDSHGKN